jgi:hypothetical protein
MKSSDVDLTVDRNLQFFRARHPLRSRVWRPTNNVKQVCLSPHLSLPSPIMPQVIVSSDSDSDDGHPSPTAPQKAKARRKHDEVPGNETPPPRTRKPSQKVAVMGEPNLP